MLPSQSFLSARSHSLLPFCFSSSVHPRLAPPPFLPCFVCSFTEGSLIPPPFSSLSVCSFVNGSFDPSPPLPCKDAWVPVLLCGSDGPRPLGPAPGRSRTQALSVGVAAQRTRRAWGRQISVPAQSTLVPLLPVPSLLLALSRPD